MLEEAIDNHNDYEREIAYEQGVSEPASPYAKFLKYFPFRQGLTMGTTTDSIMAPTSAMVGRITQYNVGPWAHHGMRRYQVKTSSTPTVFLLYLGVLYIPSLLQYNS